ncbi:E3 ubiquitin-protein ligase ubr1 [Pleurostoma richardsiae]|uniref:E3 ubiquitin-protein ligase n=1 Tax=Pleurostoma richardsiae TaxID=41990 RepID=A0AA38RA90_9PEZI|nr:E3 ubiquitin-protein ligase ubr1 [Pleurostoma richardsiae]
MEPIMSTQERQLCQLLMELPSMHSYRYSEKACRDLLQNLFWCMAGGKPEYMKLLFPSGSPGGPTGPLPKLKEAQGAVEGAEYTEAARGKACGHIFKAGEASYSCRTCSTDDTCCLCSKCFDATDHTGHMVRISISPGNSGCCDCGDPEAWKRPMFCTIHSIWEHEQSKGKEKVAAGLPMDLEYSIRMTIGRVLDYLCDVISCSPEQLRQTKTVESIEQDERMSRLSSTYCGGDTSPPGEYAILLWNDEKHTVIEVRDQVARACRVPLRTGLEKAYETDAIGRSLLMYDESIEKLLEVANILEQIRVTVTIRSARDTFREQMCGTMIEWLSDISGCSVGQDHFILRQIVCEELLKPWHKGSPATHAIVGKNGIDDEDLLDQREDREIVTLAHMRILAQARVAAQAVEVLDDSDEDDADMEGGDGTPSSGEAEEDEDEDDEEDVMMVDAGAGTAGDVNMSDWRQAPPDEALEEDEATMAGYPPPPPPPPTAPRRATRDRDLTPSDSDTAEPLIAPTVYAKVNIDIPKTPGAPDDFFTPPPKPGRYWLGVPAAYMERETVPPAEDLFNRVRLDWMILFDLRMWKKLRNDLRSLYISTVVTIPEFKRVLGLRFAGLYTTLAQLYLIGDREPDHSIINISLQMLTTPSITAEIVERGNFLTSLMAILYTFLTTRQVGHPWDVSSTAVLAFDTGSVTNRRMYHFFQDLKYLFQSPHVQERLRTEERYMMQFLDLVKLHQGICPNVRAVGEHVEYETDTWISASLITREINRLCRQFSLSFNNVKEQDFLYVSRAIRLAAKSVIINSIGAERSRFTQAEIKDEVRFKTLTDFEFDSDGAKYDVVKFVVEEQPISFHHALHYTLSWLIECGKSMSREQLRALISFTTPELKLRPHSMGRKVMPRRDYGPEDYLMASFDFPLRVCAWLAQMKAGMWVRNGMSLRHQAGTYRGVLQRDVSHQRDIFMLQTALVICNPSRVLASVVDRFGMEKWVKGFFEQKATAQDDAQHLDVVEDMVHLLIVLLSDRTSLIPTEDEPNGHVLAMRRDLIHVLCFKPLSFNEICNKLPDKYQEQEEFQRVLDEISTFKAPEGVSDVGTFELKPQYIEEVDPYSAHYNKNQREESEAAYRKWIAKKTGKPIGDVVFEPKLRPIRSGVFTGLADFTATGMFAQVIYYSLLYPLVSQRLTPTVPFTRLETFLQVVLHLLLIAITEDKSQEEDESQPSFIHIAVTQVARSNFMPEAPAAKTIVALLNMMSTKDEFKSCHPRIALILKRMRQKRPRDFEAAYLRLNIPIDRISTASPAIHGNAEEERERKKKAALDRQARVMAQFQQQQKSFLANQGDIDWGDVDDLDDDEIPEPVEETKNYWKYPTGTCILCQEDIDDRRLYGTFGFIRESRILRQTDLQDPDFVREVANTPKDLDRSAEHIRPFGIAHENRSIVDKVNAAGEVFKAERQAIGKGFPSHCVRPGPVSIGCGHIMHYSCFEIYFEATIQRHKQQIARHHPEFIERQEFVCPLCKALGNAFLPIIWKGHEESYPGVLNSSADSFAAFVDTEMTSAAYALGGQRPADESQNIFAKYTRSATLPHLAEKSSQLIADAWETTSQPASTGNVFSDGFPGALGASESATPSRPTNPNGGNMMKELVAVYRRLRDTLKKNNLAEHIESDDEEGDLSSSEVLAKAVGYSISAVEIQQRGVECEYGSILLEKIPEQALTHLRILAETVTSYIAVGAQKYAGENKVSNEFRRDSERQHCQLFLANYIGAETDKVRSPVDVYEPLLSLDSFVFLCQCVFGVGAAHKMDISHLLRLCYLAEIVKVVYHLGRNQPAAAWIPHFINRQGQDASLNNFAEFCLSVATIDMNNVAHLSGPWQHNGDNKGFSQPGFESLDGYYHFVRRYAMTFLRKAAILLYVKFGVDFNSHISPTPEADELDRLTEALRVPTFDEMCTSLSSLSTQYGWPINTHKLVDGWVKHEIINEAHRESVLPPPSAVLSHPGIFELVGLPKNYDLLIEECTRRRCPTTGKDISDPMLCLLCGDVFCGQSICCQAEERRGAGRASRRIGGAQQHMRKCQKNCCIFLNIRKCAAFYLHRTSGSWSNAPYIDKYGETDMGLRHYRQLFLNQRRYDSMLRGLWLSHGVPSFISRKLEADINNGGWETI